MHFSAHTLPYHQTNKFSKIVLDYLAAAPALAPFYTHRPDAAGMAAALKARKQCPVDRAVLVKALEEQYAHVAVSDAVRRNIESLLDEVTFTVCTAHQPNLATGPLYFLYKIMHAVKLAEELSAAHDGFRFVPVYYMGSEDADFEELNHFTVKGKRYTWHNGQQGAVGRMQVDAGLLQLLDELSGQLSPYPFGEAAVQLLKKYFIKGTTIKQATFGLVNELFADYGLVVLIPDAASLKQQAIDIFEKELFEPVSSAVVSQTSEQLAREYNVQAHTRNINLFYLKDDIRERIIRMDGGFAVNNTAVVFTDDEMRKQLQQHPERFSPNVILRGLFQELILPNIAFIGGGGELAYWLQLKDLFQHYSIPFPVLLLRASLLIVEESWRKKIEKLHLTINDFFGQTDILINRLAVQSATQPLKLNGKMEQAAALFEAIRTQAQSIDPTLSQHVAALKTVSLNKLKELEKKMLRAERRKHTDSLRQIENIKQELFPDNGLQERVESFLYYYALLGPQFLSVLHQYVPALESVFTVLQAHGEEQPK